MARPSVTMAEVIRRFEGDLTVARGASMTTAQRRVLRDLGACRTSALGGRVYRCEACQAEHHVFNSCRNRHCPSCLAHRAAGWLDARRKELLPVPYFHVVFTVPEAVAELALGNKKTIYDILFTTSAQTLLKIARDPQHLGAEIGFLSVLHTWSQKLIHHPHVHCVVPGGGLSPDGERWIGCPSNFFLPVRVLSRLFRGKFIARLEKARASGDLRFAGATSGLEGDVGWRRFIRELRGHEWVVYSKPPFGSPDQVLKYLARYTHRVAISNHRLAAIDGANVSFRYRDSARGDHARTMVLPGVEFLRRFLLHVLPKSFTRIRHFGFLANSVRKAKLANCRALLGEAEVPPESLDSDTPLDQSTEPRAVAAPGATGKPCPSCGVIGRLVPIRTLERIPVGASSASPRLDTS